MKQGFPELKYVLLLSHCFIVICFMSFALCYVLINCFMFFNLFVLYLFSCFLCFAFYFVCHVSVYFCVLFIPVHIIVYSYFLFMYNFTDHCHRVENRLQFINTIPYHRDHFINWVINTCVQQYGPKANTLSRGFNTHIYSQRIQPVETGGKLKILA